MRILQINLNHCEAAQDLLYQEVKDLNIDVAIIAEPFSVPLNGAWISDTNMWTAIFACGKYPIQEILTSAEKGIVSAKINGIHIFSCYAPPRLNAQEFSSMLDKIVDDARRKKPTIIAGDFNAWATEWGSRCTNNRGNILLDTFVQLDVSLANQGTTSTFRKNGCESIIDLTFVSGVLQRNLNWRVSERFTNSDHQALLYEADVSSRSTNTPRAISEKGWSTKWFDVEVFRYILDTADLPRGPANDVAECARNLLTGACNASFPKKKSIRGKDKVFWWTENIKKLRENCMRARRLSHRGARGVNYIELRADYKAKRKLLRDEIRKSKRDSFQKLCGEADATPWGSAYRVVMSKLKGRRIPQERCPKMLREIVHTLFPPHPPRRYERQDNTNNTNLTDVIVEVTAAEILEAAKKVGTSKAPGPDNIPNIATKEALRRRPELFADLMQTCLKEGTFPRIWKKQRLILLPKPGKPPGTPSSYRPICLLDTLGKILERIIQNRLLCVSEGPDGLAANQYGFRCAKSTVSAINTVVNFVRDSTKNIGVRAGHKMLCAIIALDIKNAFNSASWDHTMTALRQMNVPPYILKILDSYFDYRVLLYETDEGTKEYNITSGVPQGSVLGPLLWNIMYNGVLKLTLPDSVQIVGFADDIAILVKSKHLYEVEFLANEAIATVSSWLNSKGLQLAEHKTEAVVIGKRKKKETATFTVGSHQIQSSESIKYLGVILDDRLTFVKHMEYAKKRASNAQVALARIMPNVGGPKTETRLLLCSVVRSILLYASPVWAGYLQSKESSRLLNTAYRQAALRVICGYRTISREAAYVLAGMFPIEMAAKYAKRRHEEDETPPRPIDRWQLTWDEAVKGRWTHRLIPKIEPWINRRHGVLNFETTQFLSGHGCFAKHLYRLEIKESARCPACPDTEETAKHVVFECHRFDSQRAEMVALAGDLFNPEGVVEFMLQTADNWDAIVAGVTKIVQGTRAQQLN